MATYTQLCYHIVFATKNREQVLTADRRDHLFRYMWGVIQHKQCHLYRINGVEEHLHLLVSIHPTIALSDFVKDLKLATSQWIRADRIFPRFSRWQDGYSAFTCSHDHKDTLIEYIKNQPTHHQRTTFADELRELCIRCGIDPHALHLT